MENYNWNGLTGDDPLIDNFDSQNAKPRQGQFTQSTAFDYTNTLNPDPDTMRPGFFYKELTDFIYTSIPKVIKIPPKLFIAIYALIKLVFGFSQLAS
jgi:hypothetical protein